MYCTVVLNLNEGSFLLESNISYDQIKDFVINWIKTDIGRGEDKRELKPKDEYYISIFQDQHGNYDIDDNCENRDLRRGILGVFLKDYKDIRRNMEDLGDVNYIKEKKYE